MSENHDEFLKDIQRQCLTVGSEHVTAMAESLVGLNNELLPTLTFLMKEAHSLKGDFNSVGFLSCSEFIHAFETALTAVEDNVRPLGGRVLEDDARVLEFFLSDALQALNSYFGELLKTLVDKEEYLKVRSYTLETLRTWKPDQRTAALTSEIKAAPEQNRSQATGLGDQGAVLENKELKPVESPSEKNLSNVSVKADSSTPVPSETDLMAAANRERLGLPTESKHTGEQESKDATAAIATDETAKELVDSKKSGDSDDENLQHQNLYLLCQNGSRQFALPIPNVMEIVQSHQWNSLPCIKKDILGMMNLRGEAVPIVNVVSTQPKEWMSSDWVIASARFVVVCRVSDRVFGIPVEQAEQVIELLPETFQKASGLSEGSVVRSISMQNQRPILVLEIAQVFAA